MITRAQVVAEARSWLDTPWRHQGCLKGIGCDCIGLVAGVGIALGDDDARAWLDDQRFRGYGRQPDRAMLLEAAATYLDQIPIAEAREGDALLMRWEGGPPRHFAIISQADPMQIIHALAQARRVREHSVDKLWRSRIVAAFRARGLVDG